MSARSRDVVIVPPAGARLKGLQGGNMMSGLERRWRLVGAVVMLLAVVTSASAQVTTGSVSGSIKDDQGLRVPGATVTLISEARGTRLGSAVTNANGDFVLPNVTADTYTVEVTMSGFRTLQRPGVAVSGGDRVSVGELTITVGGTAETVVVTSEAPLLQAQSGERSFAITSTEVDNLPVSNRSFALLSSLSPGVSSTVQGGTPTRLGGGGQNSVSVDGASVMDTGNNGLALQLNVDAIAEVKVMTAGYQAEYGRSSGLQITAVTKSGTNAFHGSVYDIMRNSDWNSNSWANEVNGTPKAELNEADWGFSFGGPVGKPGGDNKLFFFYSQEFRPRSSGGNLRQFRVPTMAERAGDFSASRDNNGAPIPALRNPVTGGTFPGNVIPQESLYTPGLNILKLWPEPNMAQQPGTSYNLEYLSPEQSTLVHQPAVRGDYQVSSNLRLTAKFAGQRNFKGTTLGTMPGFNDTYNAYPWVKTFTTTVNYTLNPTTFLEGTFGYVNRSLGGIMNSPSTNRFNVGLGDLPLLYADANVLPAGSYNRQVMEDVAPPFYVNGRAELPPQFQWGNRIGSAPPSLVYPAFLNTNPVQDVSISLTKVMGRHTAKAGFYLNQSRKAQNLNQRNALPFQGVINFGNDTNNPLDSGFGFANAAIGVFSSYTQQGSFVEGDFRYRNVEGFIQDNWKVTNQLTLDYGLRFTYQQPQYDKNGQASNFFVDRYNAANAPKLYTPGCAGASPCSGANRQAVNPVTGQILGPGTASLIGQIVPNSGDLTNGIVLAGDGISKYNYQWPALAVAPRFGFAYDVSGTQAVVVRGGAGLFYDRPDGDSIYYQSQNPPTSSSTIVRYGTLQTLGQSGVASQGVPTIINYRYDNPGLPASVQWNTGVQMALPFSTALDVSYVGQHSYDVLNAFQSNTAVNINAIDLGAAFLPQNQDPTLAQTGVPGAAAYSTDLLRPIRGYGNIDQQWQSFDRTYHSVQTSFTRRFRNGFSGAFNYTLSLSDNGTTGVPLRLDHAADGSYSVRADQAEFNELMKDQGLQRHVFIANFVWDLPDLQGDSATQRVVGAVVNDWQLSGVLRGGSGARYDVSYAYQNNGANVNLTGSPDYPARVVINGDTGSGCSSNQYQQFTTSAFSGPLPGSVGLESGRNYMVGCADHTTDLAIARNFRLGGGRALQFRLEMFNAFNTVVYNGRVTQLQLVSPTNQAIRNQQFLADGTVDPNRLKTTSAGFGAATSAQAMRSTQLQVRFTF
jgi:hypothetical protein